MASIKAFIRTEKKNKTTKIRFRLRDGLSIDLYIPSKIEINPEHWDNKKECVKAKVCVLPTIRNEIDTSVREFKNIISLAYKKLIEANDTITSKKLLLYIDKVKFPEKYINAKGEETMNERLSFFEVYDKFIAESKCSHHRKQVYLTIKHHLQKYELYMQKTNKTFQLDLSTFSVDILNSFERYLIDEVSVYEKYPDIYIQTNSRKPVQKGHNSIVNVMNVIRRFNNWSIRNEHTTHYAFSKYEPKSPLYGTPYFLTMEERNKLYKHLFTNPKLTIQRDIFIFQCCIGCRMGDLIKFTKSNIINNAIEYIAAKTMEGRPKTVRVPLNEIAKEILNKYEAYSDQNECLLPFANIHTYNYSIRKIFKEAGLDRMITKLNSKTRMSEQKPLYEVASSHIARRTFIGNLYKQVPDPNLIGALSGHIEGSKSFARYRTIDEDTKIGLVKLLE